MFSRLEKEDGCEEKNVNNDPGVVKERMVEVVYEVEFYTKH